MLETGHSGSEGPWLTWSVRGFVLRTGNYREPFAWPERGVVLDIFNLKTGWCYTGGGAGAAPKWKWNRNRNHFEPQPSEKCKKGFSIPCAIGGKSATWEQSGAASWNGLTGLADAVNAGFAANPGKLPLVKLTGVRVEKYNKGSTTIPLLQFMQWVDRPACLGGDETIDTRPSQPAVANADATATVRQAQTASRPSNIDEF